MDYIQSFVFGIIFGLIVTIVIAFINTKKTATNWKEC